MSGVTTTADGTLTRLRELPTWLLSLSAAHAHRLLTDAFAAAGARGYHYRLLAALEEFGQASQAALGNRTGIDRSDVVAALNELAEQDLVERQTDAHDRRRNVITITAAGKARLRRLDRVVAKVQIELLSPLSAAERKELTLLLARVACHHAALAVANPGSARQVFTGDRTDRPRR
jgi:DNA-binding MarR family transcriptional regulator